MYRLPLDSVVGYRIGDKVELAVGGLRRRGKVLCIDWARPALIVLWQRPSLWERLKVLVRR
jgi:hypothetical protein